MGKDKHMSDEENQVDETGDNESYDFSALGAPKEATKKKQKRVDKEGVDYYENNHKDLKPKKEKTFEERFQQPGSSNKKAITCLACGEQGHMLRECPTVDANQCFRCGQKGHAIKECPRPESDGLKFIPCFVCKEVGHLARNCPKNDGSKDFSFKKLDPVDRNRHPNNQRRDNYGSRDNWNSRDNYGGRDNWNNNGGYEKRKFDETYTFPSGDKAICLGCREEGHILKHCPNVEFDNRICYRCGETSHRLKDCKQPRSEGLKFASCFICNETGHLASQCTQNKNGIYPKGGGCRTCGANNHLQKDCPTKNKKVTQREEQKAQRQKEKTEGVEYSNIDEDDPSFGSQYEEPEQEGDDGPQRKKRKEFFSGRSDRGGRGRGGFRGGRGGGRGGRGGRGRGSY